MSDSVNRILQGLREALDHIKNSVDFYQSSANIQNHDKFDSRKYSHKELK
ncbi:hypothetical protein [Niveispirillum sp. BGYR6]|nr:hypothetical protein [Niveispirillum sp. BGYR6]MDG5497456.1 hypothetical protein [Niveispirillum sp. BGYR6]